MVISFSILSLSRNATIKVSASPDGPSRSSLTAMNNLVLESKYMCLGFRTV